MLPPPGRVRLFLQNGLLAESGICSVIFSWVGSQQYFDGVGP